MDIKHHPLYQEDLRYVAELPYPWDKLQNKTLLLSGATGLIGTFLSDVIMTKNQDDGLNCKVIGICRNEAKAYERFDDYAENPLFQIVPHNVNAPFSNERPFLQVDFALHLASNTHPIAYATDPIGTILTNILGTQNMLSVAARYPKCRFLFASSVEVYGENRGDTEFFKEDYCGYINSNTLRAGYPESKRAGEALCQAYLRQYGTDVVIVRLARSYGPTILKGDSRAISQFIRKALAQEDIVLKSAGTQYYSYTYVADAVSGLLTVLLCGQTGEAYNIADTASDITLKDLADLIAHVAGQKVVFETPDILESAGYSKATKARLDSAKLQSLGWSANYTLAQGIEKTLRILRNSY